MTQASLEKILSALAGIEAVLAHRQGGRADDEGQAQIDLLVQPAKELYSDGDAGRVEALRGKIRTALHALQTRLRALEGGYGKRVRTQARRLARRRGHARHRRPGR